MGMGPSRSQTPRTGLEDYVSQILQGALGGAVQGPRPPGGGTPPNEPGGTTRGGAYGGGGGAVSWADQALGRGAGGGGGGNSQFTGGPAQGSYGPNINLQDIFSNLSIPQYQGALTAGSNPLQKQALNTASGGLSMLPGMEQFGGGVMSRLLGQGSASFAPPGLSNLLTQGAGRDMLQGLGGAQGAIGQLMQQGGNSNQDFGGILAALNGARQGALQDSNRDISERFSESGLRNSTDLAGALGTNNQRSADAFLGQAAQLLPELTGQRTQALGMAGQLGLGAGQALQQGNLQAGDILGQLFQGQQGRGLSALQSLPGAAEIFSMLPQQAANNAFQLGASQQGMDTQGLQAKYNEFTRTQGGLLPMILNYAAGAPQITGPGKGSQLLGAGTSIAGGLLG
jgi:hypothetical protein